MLRVDLCNKYRLTKSNIQSFALPDRIKGVPLVLSYYLGVLVINICAGSAFFQCRYVAGVESAGLALVEIYRDVKTGHPDEAVAIFEQRLPVMRDQLGHRVADAYALAARAYDLLGRTAEAQDAYMKATLLSPLIELHRRYPEVEKLAGRYAPSPAPPEAA